MTKIIAHAGCENTRPGSLDNIRTAVQCGVDIIEIDLRVHNGLVLLSHDSLDLEKIDQYLTLQSAVKEVYPNDVCFNCDLKEKDTLKLITDILINLDMDSRSIFTGYYLGECDGLSGRQQYYVNAEHTNIVAPQQKLDFHSAQALIQYFKSKQRTMLDGFNVEYTTLTEEVIDMFRKAEIPICCWTVDDKEAIKWLLEYEVFAITTNEVSYAVKQRAILKQKCGCYVSAKPNSR